MGIVIAIDGPAGSGKSTTAREVARQLNYTYIDTGAMYRAVTLAVIRANVSVEDHLAVTDIAAQADIRFAWIDDNLHTLLDGEDVSSSIRSVEVAQLVSPVSAIGSVRDILVKRQREMANTANIVMEGRDIGTNVFPQADFKFYLEANLETRARRRIADYQKIGQNLTIPEIMAEIEKRDKIDSSRQHSPLKKAADAIIIDTSNLKFEEQVERIIQTISLANLSQDKNGSEPNRNQ
ncbi:MAG: (d)CMP kinase [Candidatus Marinimicrobia bacterium]|jgi:cytidylate kinase|nr:(d)CMP kinase [Candidatus Neomarinimicrobiota bacterium]MCK9559079.1 (d)CMP kinase [Candidatus Neomarinimicrobiota bacterium]MDD5062361.1 (d)CMP kinase [Candidatus Neomarinimicrobiota bacterium]